MEAASFLDHHISGLPGIGDRTLDPLFVCRKGGKLSTSMSRWTIRKGRSGSLPTERKGRCTRLPKWMLGQAWSFNVVGDDIAQIEIEAKNEYLGAQDWTRTQHEKYWNVEYYQYLDEEKQIAIFDSDKYYDKKIVMTFDEHFQDYDKIWYRWHARNMYEWAAEDNFSRFLGFGIPRRRC